MIRPVQLGDTASICDIYNYYVMNTIVTFEETAVPVDEMLGRISDITAKFPWLVYEKDRKIIGYAYASSWKSRCAYRYSVESTVYLENGQGGGGIGSSLYEALLIELKKKDIHSVIGGVAMPNDGSVALHKKFGFEHVARFKEVGFKFDKWIDVTYWEKIITK